MERLHKQGELILHNVKEGDIIEITEGVFLRVKKINLVTEEDLAGTKKTNVYLKGEVISNEGRTKRIKQSRDSR
jgi:hypothetical protein